MNDLKGPVQSTGPFAFIDLQRNLGFVWRARARNNPITATARERKHAHGRRRLSLPRTGCRSYHRDLDGWKKVEGNPTMKTWIQHTSADGSVISGTWEATPGTYHATYGAYEFVHLIDGQITITPDGGTSVTMTPGCAFTVEPGFAGTWKIEKPVKKHFCIKLK